MDDNSTVRGIMKRSVNAPGNAKTVPHNIRYSFVGPMFKTT